MRYQNALTLFTWLNGPQLPSFYKENDQRSLHLAMCKHSCGGPGFEQYSSGIQVSSVIGKGNVVVEEKELISTRGRK